MLAIYSIGGKKMPKEKEDLRVVKTRAAIKDAFISLIEEKGFNALTVKDITMKAQINRGTFYTHFEDKYDLMNRYEEDFMQGFLTILQTYLPLENNLKVTNQTLPLTIHVFEYLYEKRQSLKAFLSPQGDPHFHMKIKEFMWQQLFENNPNLIIDQAKLLVPPEYFTAYVASAHIGVIQKWLDGDCQESPAQMAQILSIMMMKGPFVTAGILK